MATYNVNMKQFNGTSFDDVLPLAYDSQLFDGKTYDFIYDKIFNDSQEYPRSLPYIGVGQYTGTGTYGKSSTTTNDVTITFPDSCLMFMFPDTGTSVNANRIVFINDLPTSYPNSYNVVVQYTNSPARLFVKRSADNKSISWYNSDSATEQMNKNNKDYFYAYVCKKI